MTHWPTTPGLPERWPWGTLRIGTWLLPSFLALALAGLALAMLVVTGSSVLLGRNPLLPLALATIGAALFVAQGLRRRSSSGNERHAVLPSLLLLFSAWTALLLAARLPVLPTLDLLSLGLAVQLAVGRLGCTLAGCCYGLPASWGLVHPAACGQPPAGVRRLPVTLLEAGGWLLIAISLTLALATAPAASALALLLLQYGLLRSALEPLRGDPVRRWRGLRPAQLQAALCIVLGLVLAQPGLQRLLPGAWSDSGTTTVSAGIGEPVLVVIGLLAALWLLRRRDLWGGAILRLPEERRLGLEAFALSLLDQPPSRQVQVRQLGDLRLGVCRQGSGPFGEWQISVQRRQPPLSRAEAEWTLETIAAALTDQPGPAPLVLGGADGLVLIVLADPTIPPSGTVHHGADDPNLPEYFLPLLLHPEAATSGNSSLKSGADVRSPAGASLEGFRIDDGDCWAGQKPWRSTPKQS